MSRDLRRSAVRYAKYVLALAALLWVLSRIDWRRTFDLLLSLDAGTIAVILVVTAGEFVSRFYSLHVLFGRIDETDFASAVNVDLVVRFINQLLPSRFSGRSISPLVIRHFTGFSWGTSVAIAGVDIAFHAVLYGVVALLGLVVSFQELPVGLASVIAISIGLYFAAGLAVIVAGWNLGRIGSTASAVGERLSTRWTSAFRSMVPPFTDESVRTFRLLLVDQALWLLYGGAWLARLVVFPGIRVWVLLGALGVQFAPVVVLPLLLVMAYSVTLLPITPGGIGVAEASATAVFTSLGLPYEEVVLVVFLDRILGVYVAAFAGWLPSARLDFGDLRS